MKTTRRTFVQASGLTALAASRVWGSNDRINIAIVGVGSRGQAHIAAYAKQPEANIYALCDVDQANLERSQAKVKQLTGTSPKGLADMREVFADKEVHAVSMPLPNHWHALATVWACQAGKDVYIEKPASHDPNEGKQMVAAARKYGRMVQVGSQGRSAAHKIHAMEKLKEGAIGQVYMARGICFKRRKSIGHTPDEPVPPGVDWDKFLGPAPKVPFSKNRFLYNWHWFWDTGNGDIGNQGVHEMDIARWGLGVDYPDSVVASGGKYVYNDDQQTPNTLLARFNYGGKKELVFEVRGLQTGTESALVTGSDGNTVGDVFFGDEGWLSLDNDGYRLFKGDPAKLVQSEKAGEDPLGPHVANFLAAVRSRKKEDLRAEIEIAKISADLCHMANISYRLGGQVLKFDAANGQFADTAANALAKPAHRAPYTLPDLE